jgi:hypothetical protein
VPEQVVPEVVGEHDEERPGRRLSRSGVAGPVGRRVPHRAVRVASGVQKAKDTDPVELHPGAAEALGD